MTRWHSRFINGSATLNQHAADITAVFRRGPAARSSERGPTGDPMIDPWFNAKRSAVRPPLGFHKASPSFRIKPALEKVTSPASNPVHPFELTVLLPKLLDPLRLRRGHTRCVTIVDVGLLDRLLAVAPAG